MISDRTARRWMRFARHGREVADKTAIVADLTFAEMEAALFLKDKQVIGLRQGTEKSTEWQIKIDEIEILAARRGELRKRREAWLSSESEYTADGMEEAIAIIIENARIETEWFDHYPATVNEAWPVAYRRRLAEIAKADDPRSVVIGQMRCGEYPRLDENISAIKAGLLRGIILADRVRDFHDLDEIPKARDAAIKKILG